MSPAVQIAIAIAAVIVWIGGSAYAETWLRKYISDHNRRMKIAPILGTIWWLVGISDYFVLRHVKKHFTELHAECTKEVSK